MPIVREPYTGAWQNNDELRLETALANPVVFRCVSLIASDIGKLPLRLVAVDANGIWHETTSPAFSPVLRMPNRYQTPAQFFEVWMSRKLLWGNTYVLKDRDARGVVTALYVLDPCRVKPLVAPDGSVYYELQTNDLAGIPTTGGPLVVPAREIIHDRWNCAFHPLVGLSPLYACGGAARQGLAMQAAQYVVLLERRPAERDADRADRDRSGNRQAALETWHCARRRQDRHRRQRHEVRSGRLVGRRVAMDRAGGLDGENDRRLFRRADLDGRLAASSRRTRTTKRRRLQYHSQCLQTHLTAIEAALDAGLELPAPYGTEFDLDDLIWMDTATKTKAAHDAISAGAMSPNEARRKYFGLGPVPGGDYAVPAAAVRTRSKRSRCAISASRRRPAGESRLAAATPAEVDAVTLTYSRVTLAGPLWTMAEVKAIQLRITDAAHDADVDEKLATAQEAVLAYLGPAADATWTPATAPVAVKHAILLLTVALLRAPRRRPQRPDERAEDAVIWKELQNLLAMYRDPALA